jgi:hypothetical protein
MMTERKKRLHKKRKTNTKTERKGEKREKRKEIGIERMTENGK